MVPDKAHALNQELTVVDAHHDIAMDVAYRRRLGQKGVLSRLWGTRLRTAGVNVQVLPCFVEDRFLPGLGLRTLLQTIEAVLGDLNDDSTVMCLTTTMEEVDNALAKGQIASILALEGCDGLSGDPAMLRLLFRLGVRIASLTWSRRNEFADGTGESGGLSNAGKGALQEMAAHKVICDVSHLADAGFWDVVEYGQGPFIASHSNARAVCDHPRNLSDDQLRAIAEKGGMVGLNFFGGYVDPLRPTLDRLVDHLVHIAGVIGIEHVGIGPDFLEDSLRDLSKDALKGTLHDPALMDQWIPECDGIEHLPAFTARLMARGFSRDEIASVLGANFLRLFREVWA
jgi:membrane dipeptidase